MRSTRKNAGMRLGHPPSSADEAPWAPNTKTLSVAAKTVIVTGTKSATAYHTGETRQRTIRRSKPPTPLLPLVACKHDKRREKRPEAHDGQGGELESVEYPPPPREHVGQDEERDERVSSHQRHQGYSFPSQHELRSVSPAPSRGVSCAT